jgi:hypothetical protein
MRLKLESRSLKLFFSLYLFFSYKIYSQTNNNNLELYSLNLELIESKDIPENSIIVSSKNCITCVEYLNEMKLFTSVIVVVDELNLMEFRRIISSFNLINYNFYMIKNTEIFNIGPMVIFSGEIISYDHLVKISKNFTLSRKKFKNNLK